METYGEEHNENLHDESNVRRKVHKWKRKKEELSVNCHGIIRTFTNVALLTIDNDKVFIIEDPIEVEGKKLSDDVIQSIKNNEAIEATRASVKDKNTAGWWMIEDNHKFNRCQNELLSNQWTQNAAIASEATMMLDIVTTVVKM